MATVLPNPSTKRLCIGTVVPVYALTLALMNTTVVPVSFRAAYERLRKLGRRRFSFSISFACDAFRLRVFVLIFIIFAFYYLADLHMCVWRRVLFYTSHQRHLHARTCSAIQILAYVVLTNVFSNLLTTF